MDRKTFLGAAVATSVLITPTGTETNGFNAMRPKVVSPSRDSVTFLLNVGDRVTEYSFYIDEHSSNLMGMFRALCIAAEGEYVSRVVLPREAPSA